MPFKIEGSVHCGHCRKNFGDKSCPSCGAVVCEPCAADWTSCDEPISREWDLGWGSSLRAVSPGGRWALYQTWRSTLRLWEVGTDRTRSVGSADGTVWFLGDEYLLYQQANEVSPRRMMRIEGGLSTKVYPAGSWVIGGFADGVLLRHHDESIGILWDTAAIARFYPLSREVVQSAAWCPKTSTMAVGTYGRVDLHLRDGSQLERMGSVRFGRDVRWVALGAGVLAAHSDDQLVVFKRSANGVDSEPSVRIRGGSAWALDPLGEWVAVSLRRQLHLIPLSSDTMRHSVPSDGDTVVHFTSDGGELVTGHRRVMLRPRGGENWHQRVVPMGKAS